MWHLPSLAKIAVLPASMLYPDCRSMSRAGISVPVLAVPELIPFFGRASLTSEESTSDPLKAKSTLTFNISTDPDIHEPKAFIAEDHQGQRWLMGAFEPPFPEIRKNNTTGSSPTDTKQVTVTVSWTHPPVRCTVLLPGD